MEKLLDLKGMVKKLSSLIDHINGENISLIEKDILLQYVRDLYSFISELDIKNEVLKEVVEEPVNKFNKDVFQKYEAKEDNLVNAKQDFSIDFIEEIDEASIQNEDVLTEKTIEEEITEEIIIEHKIIEESKVEVSVKETIIEHTNKRPEFEQANLFSNSGNNKTIGEQLRTNTTSLNDILAQNNQREDISSIMNLKPISDIRSSIGVGDRFLYIRELFNGSGDVFEETILHLNSLDSIQDAKNYLSDKFNWNEANESVMNFMSVVKRRYL